MAPTAITDAAGVMVSGLDDVRSRRSAAGMKRRLR